jgi:hypothetical protein
MRMRDSDDAEWFDENDDPDWEEGCCEDPYDEEENEREWCD